MDTISSDQSSQVALEAIVSNAIQIPGVKVDRQKFLAETFAKENTNTQQIIDLGPIKAGCTRETLAHMADKLIFMRTSTWRSLSRSNSVTLARKKCVAIRGHLSMWL